LTALEANFPRALRYVIEEVSESAFIDGPALELEFIISIAAERPAGPRPFIVLTPDAAYVVVDGTTVRCLRRLAAATP
jgi:hypothetical protein